MTFPKYRRGQHFISAITALPQETDGVSVDERWTDLSANIHKSAVESLRNIHLNKTETRLISEQTKCPEENQSWKTADIQKMFQQLLVIAVLFHQKDIQFWQHMIHLRSH